MKSLTDKLQDLKVHIKVRLASKLKSKGEKSQHCSDTVLKVKCAQMFNIEGGRWLSEISHEKLIDNEGYSYIHDVLPIEQLCEAIDNV
jgi:hypothetical protein